MKEAIKLGTIYSRLPYLPLIHLVIQITTTKALKQPAVNLNMHKGCFRNTLTANPSTTVVR